MKKKIIYIIIFLLTLNLTAKEWTIMFYLNGDNNLDEYAFIDFNELESFGSNENIDIVVQYDRGHINADADWNSSRRYYIKKDSDMRNINSDMLIDLGEIDSGDYNTVIDFVTWSKKRYPAEKYALIIWNHGDGWSKKKMNLISLPDDSLKKGISYDDQSENYISVSKGDFEKMLSKIKIILGKKIDFLGLDACLMGMWEVAYSASNYAKFMVASEELENGTGWQYNSSLSFFNNNRTIENLCREIVKNSIDSVGATLSCLNLENMNSLNISLDNFATEFIENHDIDTEILISATETVSMDELSSHKDLLDFFYKLKKRVSDEIITTYLDPIISSLNNIIVINRTKGNRYSDAKGLAIYMPVDDEYDTTYSTGRWSLETKWDQFIQKEFFFKPDQYEPDNSFEEATDNIDLSSQEHSINVKEDSDYIKFHLKADNIYEFLSESSSYDTMIFLYNDSQELLLSNDDGGIGKSSLIRYITVEDEVVYLKIQTYSHDSVALYTLKIREIEIADDYPDKISDITESDKLKKITQGKINYDGDIDLFYINLEKDKSYSFETKEFKDGLDDTLLYLFNSSGDLVLENDDIDKDNKNYFSKIEWKATASGKYFLGIKAYEDNIGDYQINFDEIVCNITNNGKEICDGIDNNCNFIVDDNANCDLSNSNSSCIDGGCKILNCYKDYYDYDRDLKNGCEYFCERSNKGKEICDGIDNDCDGKIDEDENICAVKNGEAVCDKEKNSCIITNCEDHYYNLNNNDLDGCEYFCKNSKGKKEICSDNIDNNCNGKIDENCSDGICSFGSNNKYNNFLFLFFILCIIFFKKYYTKKFCKSI